MPDINTRFPEEVLKTAVADGKTLDRALAAAVLTDEVQKFDPDQARDEAGKWTEGGGGGSRFSNLGAVPQGRGGGGGGGGGKSPVRVPKDLKTPKEKAVFTEAASTITSFGYKQNPSRSLPAFFHDREYAEAAAAVAPATYYGAGHHIEVDAKGGTFAHEQSLPESSAMGGRKPRDLYDAPLSGLRPHLDRVKANGGVLAGLPGVVRRWN